MVFARVSPFWAKNWKRRPHALTYSLQQPRVDLWVQAKVRRDACRSGKRVQAHPERVGVRYQVRHGACYQEVSQAGMWVVRLERQDRENIIVYDHVMSASAL